MNLLQILILGNLTISQVKVHNAVCNQSEFYKAVLLVHEGTEFDQERVDKRLKYLIRTGAVSQAIVKAVNDSNGVRVDIEVRENPKLDSIIFKGNKKIKAKDILKQEETYFEEEGERVKKKKKKKLFPLIQGQAFSDKELFDAIRFIKELYAEKGYPETEVKYEVIRKGCFADVIFHIKEGPKARIKKILIFGNTAFPDKKLIGKMKNKPKSLFRSGKLQRDQLPEDMRKIEEFYKNHGYMHAKVDSYKVEFKGKDIFIKIWLTEGKRYRNGFVEFEGNELFPDSILKPLWELKKGKYFSLKKLQKSLENIQGLYGDSGYIYANVVPIDSITQDTIVNFKVHIYEGVRVRVRKVNIFGNTKTYEAVIRRELYLFPGEYFSREKAIRSQRNLYYLNYFSNVMMDFQPTGDSEQIDINIKVEEKSTGQLGLGATYSQAEGLSFFFQIQEPNFRGTGQRVGLMVEYGKYKHDFSLNYSIPWIGGKRRYFSGSIYYTTSYLPWYSEHREGFSVNYRYRFISDYNYIGLGYTLERINLFNVNPEYLNISQLSEWVSGKKLLTSAITLSFTRDTRDRSFNAMSGERTVLTTKLSGGPLLGDVNFLKTTLEHINLFNYKKKVILAIREFTGWITGLSYPLDVPLYERFFLGDIGPFGLRGYEQRSVGPLVNGVNIGGRLFFIGNIEIRYRFSETMYALSFFDIGNAWLYQSQVSLSSLKKGVGIGIRMELPMMGVIGFDIGYGIDNNGGKWVPHIQLGTQF